MRVYDGLAPSGNKVLFPYESITCADLPASSGGDEFMHKMLASLAQFWG
jgi:hypothetical protein